MNMNEEQLEKNFLHQVGMYSGLGILKQREIIDSYWRDAIAKELPAGDAPKWLAGLEKSLRKTSRRK